MTVPTAPIEDFSAEAKPAGVVARFFTFIARLLLSLFVPIVTFIVLYAGFMFLRDSDAPKGIVAIVAIIWGVGGVALLYLVSNWFVERLGDPWRARLQPFVFVGPAVAILCGSFLAPRARWPWAWSSLCWPTAAASSVSPNR